MRDRPSLRSDEFFNDIMASKNHAGQVEYTLTIPETNGPMILLTVNSCIKVRLDLQADKSPVVVKGPFFPRVVNPRYRIRGTNV
jgi:hypothetical protein